MATNPLPLLLRSRLYFSLSSGKQKLKAQRGGDFRRSLHESLKLSPYRLNAKPLGFSAFLSSLRPRMQAKTKVKRKKEIRTATVQDGARCVGDRNFKASF